MVEAAERDAVLRRSVHHWVHRYREEGLAGPADRSQRQHQHLLADRPGDRATICELRRNHYRRGPRQLGHELARSGVTPEPCCERVPRAGPEGCELDEVIALGIDHDTAQVIVDGALTRSTALVLTPGPTPPAPAPPRSQARHSNPISADPEPAARLLRRHHAGNQARRPRRAPPRRPHRHHRDQRHRRARVRRTPPHSDHPCPRTSTVAHQLKPACPASTGTRHDFVESYFLPKCEGGTQHAVPDQLARWRPNVACSEIASPRYHIPDRRLPYHILYSDR
ncbi:helix-turn-helix domain-containing protein [Pseudonocardia petroleophila]|uniref:Helix-turn-helix domain-containing protein n=1 Tax=Pseudonocardia petroleophila TaxID=37331 RepID=A0A7G7MKK1_9PSEU|nr:helix-turn-helix domain-containing protein [Pseudonocardia petroleophila]